MVRILDYDRDGPIRNHAIKPHVIKSQSSLTHLTSACLHRFSKGNFREDGNSAATSEAALALMGL